MRVSRRPALANQLPERGPSNGHPMIAAIYARKSTDQNVADEEKSVTRQVERARAYAERKGWTVDPAYIFIDDGISGADFVRRDGFVRLMNTLKPRAPFQALVMMEQSRLGRSLDEVPMPSGASPTPACGSSSTSTDAEVKRDTAVDRFQASVMAFVDEMHREQSRQRTRDAMRRKAERGHVAGGVVFGYDNARIGDHVERVVNPEQAEVIRRIFREIAAGAGFTRIAKRLNAEGIPSPRPKKHGWATSGVREIVLRETYRGRLTYGKTRWEDRHGTKRKIDVPASEWLTLEAPALRIVDEALWGQAHARLTATRESYARLTDGRLVGRPAADRGPGYLLTGFLRCAACEGPVFCQVHTTRKGATRRYYVCATQRTRGMCPGGGLRVGMEALDQAVLDAVEASLLTPERLAKLVERVAARRRDAAARMPAERAQLERQLGEARKTVDRFVRAIGEGLDLTR